jgi:hypothetical protein
MANANQYAEWLVANEAKKGTPEFETVAAAYREADAEEKLQSGQYESVLGGNKDASVPRKLSQSMLKGVSGLGDLVLGGPENFKRLYQYATTEGMPVPRASTPSRTFLTEKGILTPEAEFKSPVGRVAGFTTELMAGGGINPFSMTKAVATKPLLPASREIGSQIGRTAFQGIAGGSTSELMNSIGINSPVAQFLATGGAMTAAGVPIGGVRSTPADIVNRNLKGVTPEQMRMADLLQKDSTRMGMPLTGPEAIAQVSGQRGLTSTQRFLEQAEPSQGTMNQFMAGRPAGVEQGFGNVMQSVSPRAPTSATPFNLQQAGKNVIRGAEKNLTASVDPFYKQGMTEMQTLQTGKPLPVLPSEVAALKSNKELGPAIQDAITKVTQDSYYKVKGLPESDPRVLNAAKIYLDTQYKNFSKTMSDSEDAIKAGTAWGASRQLDSYLSSKSPTYAQGSRNFEIAQKTQFDPMQRSPVGQIAEGKVGRDVLMPPAPVSLYPADIKRTADLLRRKDPAALPDWTRQNLEGIFNETTQKLSTGDNQFGGAKFAATIAGNKQQRDNLRTLVTETGGMQAWQGFEKFLDVAEAQGQRMTANSATSFNEMIKNELGTGIASKTLTMFKPQNIVNWAENLQLGRNANMLAKMLTDPDSVAKLQELARTGPRSAKAQTLVNSIAGGYIAQKPEITEEQ